MLKLMPLLRGFVALSLVFLAQPALAQKTGPNGGLLAGKSGHETELVVSPEELTVYLIDHGKVHGVKGVTMRAVIQASGKNTTVTFVEAADGNKMVAKLAAPLASGAIVVLTGKDDHGDAISSRYVIN